DVFKHRHLAEEFQVLEGPPNTKAGASIDGRARDGIAFEPNLAGAGGEMPRYQIEQRRFAGAVGADQSVNRAGSDLHGDVANGNESAEAPGKPAALQQGARHYSLT